MIKGVEIKPIRKLPDERGFFMEIFRKDWEEFHGEEILQTNLSISYPNIIRAWHRHLRGQNDYFIVIRGTLKICIFDDETRELTEIISAGEMPQVVKVPGHFWHGFKVVGNEPAYLVYFVNKMYVYENPDEERRPWNDPSLIPASINGDKTDQRVEKPWDWNYPPHR